MLENVRSIAPFYTAFKGANVYIVGTGPSLDKWIKEVGGKDRAPGVYITINRACMVLPDAEFCMFDTPYSIGCCAGAVAGVQRIIMPMFSLGRIALYDKTIQENISRIFWYVWDYNGWDRLRQGMFDTRHVGDNVLSHWLLFIHNGNVQSAAVFAKFIGAAKITFIGIDGNTSGQMFSQAFGQHEKRFRSSRKIKQQQKYRSIKENLVKVLTKVKIPYTFYC